MSITLLFFLSILLHNFRNLVIFCMNVEMISCCCYGNFLTFFLNRAAIYIDHYLACVGGVGGGALGGGEYLISGAYSLFFH